MTIVDSANGKIGEKSQQLLHQLLTENPDLNEMLDQASSPDEFLINIRKYVQTYLNLHPAAKTAHDNDDSGGVGFQNLEWSDYAAIRLMDYVDNAGLQIEDLNWRGKIIENDPLKLLWLASKYGTGDTKSAFFTDMIELFRQFSGLSQRKTPSKTKVLEWMNRHPSGLEPKIIELREKNRERILKIIIDKISRGNVKSTRYVFEAGMTESEKLAKALDWWKDRNFHLKFAVRSPEELNEMLDYTLDDKTMTLLREARDKGIPTFVNPYYLSLLNANEPVFAAGTDAAIRAYALYSQQLVDEFGHIVAWEKEDTVVPGIPNPAGWLLPYHNVHRRYPNVAILIPDTMGRACGGLCASCQRMYGFQDKVFHFNLEELKAKENWNQKLPKIMDYFKDDSQLRDILITGGDALMSSDKSLRRILDAVYDMAVQKRIDNQQRADGEKYAEIFRVRLGTRLPIYLPQRMTPDLINVLSEFKEKASKAGIKQFIIQTHFESSIEITPEARDAVKALLSSGWFVTNQLVFTAAASKRGHTAKLRQTLAEIGVLPYYTFTVKGYMENNHNFATNERAVQEQIEEKAIGAIPDQYQEAIKEFPLHAEDMIQNIEKLQKSADLPFLATDRNVLNLPGIGKSLTFRVVGLTSDGRRILEFDHDANRAHSPVIEKMGTIMIVESKSITQYLEQMEELGESAGEYQSIFGYSIGETEPRMAVYEYPKYDFELTKQYTNLDISGF